MMIYHNYLFHQDNCKILKTSCLTLADTVNSRYADWLDLQGQDFMNFAKGSNSTRLYETYNVFLCHLPGFAETYNLIISYFKEKNLNYKKYAVSGWVNVHNAGSYLDWHIHGSDPNIHDGRWHGYVSVNAEPSNTFYKTKDNEVKTIVNKNGYITLSPAEMQHRTSVWKDEDEPRITIAFDFILRDMVDSHLLNKWIPVV